MFRHERKAHVACNFNCLIEIEGLLKVTDTVGYNGNISDTVQERDVVTTDH